jgi:hypothetical protein
MAGVQIWLAGPDAQAVIWVSALLFLIWYCCSPPGFMVTGRIHFLVG